MASFVQTGDPNAHKLINASVPRVPRVDEGKQFLVTAQGIRQGGVSELERRCGFWLGVAGQLPV